MVANILPTDTLSAPGVRPKGQNIFFSESSNQKEWSVGCRAPCKQNTPFITEVGSKGQNFFSESSHFAYQIKGKEMKNNMQAKTLTLHTLLNFGVGLKGQILKVCYEVYIFFIELSTKT